MIKYSAEPNPYYPGKGQRPFCILRIEENGSWGLLPKQFNKRHTAAAEAYRIQVAYERRINAVPYLGD